MTYSESAEGIWLDERRVVAELARHGLTETYDLQAFKDDCPCDDRKGQWKASTVLDWLGY